MAGFANLRLQYKFLGTEKNVSGHELSTRIGHVEDLAAHRFPRLRHCVSAGEPLNPEVIEIWKSATGLTIYEGYGQTETKARSCLR